MSSKYVANICVTRDILFIAFLNKAAQKEFIYIKYWASLSIE